MNDVPTEPARVGCFAIATSFGMSTKKVISAEQKHRFFIDTEFIESGPNRPIELLSIALVAEDGREFYAVNSDAVLANANEWVRENVIPHLGGPRLSLADIRGSILRFIGDVKPEFWGYYADYGNSRDRVNPRR